MTHRLLLLTAAALLIAQLSGCYYYLDMTPKIVISSQPFTVPQPTRLAPLTEAHHASQP